MKKINLRNIFKIYSVLRLRYLIKNTPSFVYFLLFPFKNRCKIILQENMQVSINREQVDIMITFLNVLKYSMEFHKIDENTVEISFDKESKFRVALDFSTFENVNLIKLFYYGVNNGAIFKMEKYVDSRINHKKIVKILERDDKKILETSEGLQFYLDSIDPWIFIETFILKIHEIKDNEIHDNETIIDIGANVGDTAIFYANKGAQVYAFEPVKEHYDSMLKNINLNPKLKNKIIPINAAVGKDGMVTIYQSNRAKIASGASIFFQTHEDSQVSKIEGYGFDTMFKKFNIKTVDLLKMDCKGCEFFLTSENLKNVKNIKIEYTMFDNHKIEDLTKVLKDANFKFIIYQHNPNVESLLTHGTIYATKYENQNYLK